MTDIAYVNDHDEVIGSGSKEEALKKGIPHRLIHVFIFNSKGQLLIQKRALRLAAAGGKWDSSASGHVDAGEEYVTAAERELSEEMGIHGVPLTEKGRFFSDRSNADEIKKRFHTIYTGTYEGEAVPDVDAISETRWIGPDELEKWTDRAPEEFTASFLKSFKYLRGLKD